MILLAYYYGKRYFIFRRKEILTLFDEKQRQKAAKFTLPILSSFDAYFIDSDYI
jgi:hypothetical protein